jgi:hypothetical protein
MSSLLPQLISKLKADAGVSALVGSRVYADFVPEDVEKPCVYMYITSEDSTDSIIGMINFDEARVRIEAVGTSRESADNVSQAVRVALNNLLSTSYSGTDIQGISQATGKIHLVDIPNDGTDRWQFRTSQSFLITYHPFD